MFDHEKCVYIEQDGTEYTWESNRGFRLRSAEYPEMDREFEYQMMVDIIRKIV